MFNLTPIEFIVACCGAFVSLALPLDDIFWWMKR
jgi:hypothetical protein